MTWLSILSLVFRFLGFLGTADKLWAAHEAKVQAKAVANTPKTDDEWTQKAKDGEL